VRELLAFPETTKVSCKEEASLQFASDDELLADGRVGRIRAVRSVGREGQYRSVRRGRQRSEAKARLAVDQRAGLRAVAPLAEAAGRPGRRLSSLASNEDRPRVQYLDCLASAPRPGAKTVERLLWRKIDVEPFALLYAEPKNPVKRRPGRRELAFIERGRKGPAENPSIRAHAEAKVAAQLRQPTFRFTSCAMWPSGDGWRVDSIERTNRARPTCSCSPSDEMQGFSGLRGAGPPLGDETLFFAPARSSKRRSGRGKRGRSQVVGSGLSKRGRPSGYRSTTQ